MTQTQVNTEQAFLNYVKKMNALGEALSIIFWDLRTGAPKNGVSQRAEVIGTISSEIFSMSTSDEMKQFLDTLSTDKTIQSVTKKLVEELKKSFDRNKKIPEDEFKAYTILQSKAESVWEEAKEKQDFSMFQPYLEQIVAYKKKFVSYWGYEGNKYNALLDIYEPGVTVEILDNVFARLRESIVSLVKRIQQSPNKPETAFLSKHFPKAKQTAFSKEILKQIGYDFESGRLDETVHPFAIGINAGDVRITTNYDESDWRTAIFGTIHEGGHALYEQNISKELEGTPLHTGTSMGIHESQSLFYENFVGRSKQFWKKNYDILKSFNPEPFEGISLDAFYAAVNESKASLIRIDADMLTYALHIIVRYETEKGLINDTFEVKDLPQIWNDKYEEYLGIRPSNDGEGVLQDVHWSGGDFGYFPSYALGYMYAAQFKHALENDLPFEQLLEEGDLLPIKQWFNEKVHQFGKMKEPLEILQDVTGEGLNPTYLIEYLEEKYTKVYQL